MWLDGASAPEGRVGGAARELFLDMNGRALRAEDPGDQAELAPALAAARRDRGPDARCWSAALDAEEILADRPSRRPTLIPGARLKFLDGVAHVPHLEGDPATLDEIAAFVDAVGSS